MMTSSQALTGWRERRRSRRDATRRAPSIRALVYAWAFVFGLPALIVLGWLVVTSTLLTNALGEVIRDSESMGVADEIELLLLGQHRLSALNTGGPLVSAERERLVAATDALLDRARLLSVTARERELVDEIDAHTTAYWAERARAEARGLSELQIRRRVQPILEDAVRAAGELRALNEVSVAQARSESLRVDELSNIAGFGVGVLLLAGVLTVVLGARRYVIRPLEDVHRSLSRFRAGDTSARLEPSGPHELREIARALNDHIETIARHREARLTFLAGVAHDLRNPLAALRMAIDLAKMDGTESTRARVFETVDRQVARLERMCGDLLDATRIEAGKLVLQRERLDRREPARQTVRLYEMSAPRHRLSLAIPEQPVLVDADPVRIEQVASNLVSNAVKYSPRGGSVDVTVSEQDGEAILAVRDEGIGIAPEAIEELFAPYSRLSTDVAGGAGLGLSVVRRIVEAHGGRVDVESAVGRGSTFRVRLPLATPGGRPATGLATASSRTSE